jgi:hypothetical protein
LSGCKKSNSGFDFSPAQNQRIAADFYNLPLEFPVGTPGAWRRAGIANVVDLGGEPWPPSDRTKKGGWSDISGQVFLETDKLALV